MDDETVSRIFEPFFTTKGPEKGTGLGLMTVRGIVTAVGGTIDVASEPGRGTTFRILMPSSRTRHAAADAKPQGAAAPGKAASETVLVVEDENLLRDVMAAMLEEHGYSVLTAPDSREAFEKFEHSGNVDLVISDVVLPGMRGPELCRELSARQPSLKTLFMSAHIQEEILRGMPGVTTPFLSKPFKPAELLATVRSVLEGSHR